jgi:3-oxoacyl-[acyl-carrier-protein] synthase-3
MNAINGFRILGSGVYLPDTILDNQRLSAELNPAIDPDWVQQRLGIVERRLVDADTQTSDMAAQAAMDALRRVDVAAESVDLFVLATASPDAQAPATACIAQHKAGLVNAVAFDVAAVCSGFMYALTVASAFLHAGRSKRAVVAAADCFSRVTDWSRRDCPFFGDGAGAVVLERETPAHANRPFFDAELFADGRNHEAFHIPRGDSFQMNAPGVFQAASDAVPRCIERVLARNHMGPRDIDVVLPHQPSISLLRQIATRSGIPFSKFRTNMDRYANTAGATIPIVFHETLEAGEIDDGDVLLFAAAGAGMTAGAAFYRWH